MKADFRCVQLGTFPDAASLLEALRGQCYPVGDWAMDILGQPSFTVSGSKVSVRVADLSVAELGFPEGAFYEEICSASVRKGFSLCPAEVGPQLRLQWRDQPTDKWVIVAMNPIEDSVGYLTLFFLGRGSGGLWLGASRGHPRVKWSSSTRFLLVLG